MKDSPKALPAAKRGKLYARARRCAAHVHAGFALFTFANCTLLFSRRLMVSQDRDEFYIIIGEYGRQYEAYIRNEPVRVGMTTANAKSAVISQRTDRAGKGPR
jgi:hypothetical protein